jgi:hypothetical protein
MILLGRLSTALTCERTKTDQDRSNSMRTWIAEHSTPKR